MRNSFEDKAATLLSSRYGYETIKMTYRIEASYLPDWYDPATNTVVETKGFFRPADMRKMKAVRAQHPTVRFILVFQRPETTISKRSKTTYRTWALRHGFEVMTLDELAGL